VLVGGATGDPAAYQETSLPGNPDVLGRLDTEGFPVGRVEEFVFAEEVFETRVACETVALFLASVVEEVVRVVEADAAIHAHSVEVDFVPPIRGQSI